MRHRKSFLFSIEAEEGEVSPETVSIPDLCQVLSRFDDAIRATMPADTADGKDGPPFSLIRVAKGSNKLTLSLNSQAAVALAIVCRAVQKADFQKVSPATHNALFELSRGLHRHKWRLRWKANKSLGIRASGISSEHSIPVVPALSRIAGDTTIFGTVLRAGGDPPKVQVRLDEESSIHADVTVEQAKELGHRLYAEVGLQGQAVWTGPDMQLTSFKVDRITEYRPGGLVNAFRELAEISGGVWDDVDAVEFVKSQRGDD